jgi:ubiquinone/menaquinone biosynthesis C-methylase UbiE
VVGHSLSSSVEGLELVDRLAGGYRGAQVLFTAVKLNLFSAIGLSERRVEDLSQELLCSKRGLGILLDALCALSLLEKEGESYRNSSTALEFLCEDSSRNRIALLRHTAGLYERWAGLPDAVRSGSPVPKTEAGLSDGERREAFARAMADVGRSSAAQTADLLNLSQARRALDVGGGPGIYAMEFARRYPQLKVTVLDDRDTLAVARENIVGAGLEARVLLLDGDVFSVQFADSYDFIFVSNVVHMFSSEKNREMVTRLSAQLRPGGRICLKDFFFEESWPVPEWSALFAVNMLVSTEGGNCYSYEEAEEWLRRAGFSGFERLEMTAQSRLLLGTLDDV